MSRSHGVGFTTYLYGYLVREPGKKGKKSFAAEKQITKPLKVTPHKLLNLGTHGSWRKRRII